MTMMSILAGNSFTASSRLLGTTGINYTNSSISGIKIGTTAPDGGSTTDNYFGPTAYSLSMSSTGSWTAVGALYTAGSETNTINRPSKSSSSGSTFSGAGSAGSPFCIVIDLGQLRIVNNARYYQMFSDGKTTHAALDYAATLQTRTGTWTELHGFNLLDNSGTSTGISVNFTTTQVQYLRLRIYNDGRYGDVSYTELFNFKLFYV